MPEMTVEMRQSIERKLIRRLYRTMKEAGFAVHSVNDGDDVLAPATEAAFLDAIFAVDEAWAYFEKDGAVHTVFIVLGNDGWDSINDWSFLDGDPDGFDAAMQAVGRYADELSKGRG